MRKNLRRNAFALGLFLMGTCPIQAQITTNGGSGLAATYPTLADAITALNAATITSPTTISLAAANPQTAPVGGYVINAQGSSTNTINIIGNNNTVTATAALVSGAINDGIFKIIGGDYITIDNFKLTENPANTTTASGTNNMTEWGIALLYSSVTNGSQNNTIKNCTIDLDRNYQNTFGIYSNSNHTATSVTVGAVPPTPAGNNSGLTIVSDTITDVNTGIVVIGPSSSGSENDGLTIGGTSTTGNMITNYGTTGTFSGYFLVSGTVNGILIRYAKNFTVSNNTIASSNGGTIAGTLRAIQIPAGTTPIGVITDNINNNSISVKSGLATGAIQGIFVETSVVNPTTTLNINNNDITSIGHTTATASGAIVGIITTTAPLVTNINNNTFTNLVTNTTGAFTFISSSYNMPAGGSQTVSGNSIVTGFNKTGAGGTVTLFTTTASSPTGTTSVNTGNNFSNITLTGATINAGWINRDGVGTLSGPTKTITNNTFSNWIGGSAAVTVLTENAGAPTSIVSGNSINNITGTAAVTGIQLLSNSNVGLQGNIVNSLSTTGAALVTGIAVTGTSNANNTPVISKNKIYDLLANNAGGTVNGILVGLLGTVSNAEVTIANNLIGDLRAPITNSTTDAVRGINISAATPALLSKMNVYYNTVYLNAVSTGTDFSTAALFHTQSAVATTSSLDLRNNILVNASTANGAGTTAAFRRSGVGLDNYAATSNNNIFYAGIPSATNVIYHDGTPYQTLADFKALVTPRETASLTENVPFSSTTGASTSFLHINNAIFTVADNNGVSIATVTDDYDGNTRSVSTPDIGADEFFGISLPISFGQFHGTRQADGIALTWNTNTEINNTGFELQRSADGTNFSKIAFVATKATNGNSSIGLVYNFTDKTPLAASNYYRLKQLDRDGRAAFSNIVLLKGGKASQLSLTTLYPNPAVDQLHVLVASPKNDHITLLVTDQNGRTVLTQYESIVNGENNIQLQVSTLAKGNYLIKAVCAAGCETASGRFIKQ